MSWRRLPVVFAACAGVAWAHTGEAPRPHDLAEAWTLTPGVVIPLVLSAVLFFRGGTPSRGVSRWQFASFWWGWMVLALALVSPIHAAGEALFCAHMVQHELLMVVAAPLLVLSRPMVPMMWALPLRWRKRAGSWTRSAPWQASWRWMTRPAMAFSLHAAALWGWHVPRWFQATLDNEWLHAAQHLSFFLTALLFWWSLLYANGRESYGAGLLYLFATSVHTSALGALLTFARTAWYPAYSGTAAAWGLTAVEDQQLGGLIMWIPAGIVYVGAGLWMCGAWLRKSEALAKEREYAH